MSANTCLKVKPFQLQISEVFFSQQNWASNRFEVTHCDRRKVSFASVAILLHACVKQWKRNRTFKAGGDWRLGIQNVWETISQQRLFGEVNNIINIYYSHFGYHIEVSRVGNLKNHPNQSAPNFLAALGWMAPILHRQDGQGRGLGESPGWWKSGFNQQKKWWENQATLKSRKYRLYMA